MYIEYANTKTNSWRIYYIRQDFVFVFVFVFAFVFVYRQHNSVCIFMHSSPPFVQAQTLSRVLKLCAKHSSFETEMQPIETHIFNTYKIYKKQSTYSTHIKYIKILKTHSGEKQSTPVLKLKCIPFKRIFNIVKITMKYYYFSTLNLNSTE